MNKTDEAEVDLETDPSKSFDPAPPTLVSNWSERLWTYLPLAAVVIFSIILRSGIASMPLERDEGEYAYIATRWLAGDVPYRDAFDQKTPGVFAAYAALFATGFRSVEAIHWLGHGALVSTVLVLCLLGRRLFSYQVGWIAGLLTVLLAMSANMLGNAANTEVFAILPLTAGLYFAVRASESGSVWDGLLTGVCGGLALMCKQVTLPVVIFSFVWVLYYRGTARLQSPNRLYETASESNRSATASARGASWFALGTSLAFGLCAVLAPVCIYFANHGAWSAFFDCVAGHNLSYAARLPLRYYGSNFWDASKFIYVLFAPIFVAAIYACYLFWTLGGTTVRFCVWWLIAAFVSTSAGGYYRNHYFILIAPPLAMISAYGIDAAAAILEPKRRSLQRGIALAFVLATVAWPLFFQRDYFWSPSIEFVCRRLYGYNPFPESKALGKLIRDNSEPDDRVFICGSEPQILFHAERVSSSRYVFVYPLFADAHGLARQKEVMEDLRRRPPKFVLMVDRNTVPSSFVVRPNSPLYIFDAILELITEEYEPFAASTVTSHGRTRLIRSASDEGGEPERITVRIFQRRAGPTIRRHEQNSEDQMKSEQDQLKANLDDVRARIDRAASTSGRSPNAVRLVAVTKTIELPIVSLLTELGVADLAESRPQELWRKHDALPNPLRWHLVGSLQKNKARRTLPLIHMIHSVDTVGLLSRLDELAVELDLQPSVLLEVNVSGESTKHGFSPSEMPGVIAETSNLDRVQVRGLMTMAPHDADPKEARLHFAALREIRDQQAINAPPQSQLVELSMGMSHDFEAAVAEGATIVRVGSALFRGIVEPA